MEHCWHTDKPTMTSTPESVGLALCLERLDAERNVGSTRWCCYCLTAQASVVMDETHGGHGKAYTSEVWGWCGGEGPCPSRPEPVPDISVDAAEVVRQWKGD